MKRVAILADIHGNAPALAAVLEDAQRQQCEEYWFLGDIFGYGPLPVSCIHLLDSVSPTVWLMGNHDLSAMRLWQGAGRDDEVVQLMTPSREQQWVAQWHATQVKVAIPESRARQLASAPTWIEPGAGVFVAHGAVLDDDPCAHRNIDANSYIKPWRPAATAMLDFLHQKSSVSSPRFIAVGHYHQPMLGFARSTRPYDIQWHAGAEMYTFPGGEIGHWTLPSVDENKTVIVNPGSVGQPRFVADDTRAAYAILEEEARNDGTRMSCVTFRRVVYNESELLAAKLLTPLKNSLHRLKWWSVIEPILREWIQQESSHEA